MPQAGRTARSAEKPIPIGSTSFQRVRKLIAVEIYYSCTFRLRRMAQRAV